MEGLLKIVRRPGRDDDRYLTGYNTMVMIGDQELQGVSAVTVYYRPDDVVWAEISLFCMQEQIIGEAIPRIMMTHPITGASVRVKRLEFYDEHELVDFNF